MKRTRSGSDWKTLQAKLGIGGFEIYTRIGSPVIIHRAYEPINSKTCWLMFFARRGGKLTKKQVQGMDILRKMGVQVCKYVPDAQITLK